MMISNSMDLSQRGISLELIKGSGAASGKLAAAPAAVAATPAPEEQPSQLATASVALRASTGQAKISNALTRAEAVALYRQVAAML